MILATLVWQLQIGNNEDIEIFLEKSISINHENMTTNSMNN